MTRTHALIQLLRLDPLTLGQIVEITGWPYRTVRGTVSHLRERGLIHYSSLLNGYCIS